MRVTGWTVAGFWALFVLSSACGGDTREEETRDWAGGGGGTGPEGGRLGTGGTLPDSGTTGGSGATGGVPGSGASSGSDAGVDAPPDAVFDVIEGGPSTDAGCMDLAELQDFSRKWGEALCDGLSPCCAKSGLSLDRNTCVSTLVSYLGRVLGGSACNRASPDLSRLAECVEKTKAYAALCEHDRPKWREANLACFSVVQGTRGLAEPCRAEFDCAQPGGREVRCADLGGGHFGCQERRLAAEGETCTPETTALVTYACDENAGLYCSPFGERTCVRPVPVGASCQDRRCDDQGFCEGGLCIARRAPGQPCQTGNTPCAIGALCDASSLTCVAQKPLGQACTEDSECLSFECVSGKCAPTTPWTIIAGCQ